MKNCLVALLIGLSSFVVAQNEDNLVFHFQTMTNRMVSDYDLVVSDEITIWQENTRPRRSETAPMGINVVPSNRPYERKIIFKNRRTNVAVYKYEPLKGLFYLSDTLSRLPWQLANSPQDSILGYSCKKATMTFRGRYFEVWYAPQIPLSEGPWKLSGLPGMILKVEISGKGDFFTMECYGINSHKIDTKARMESYLQREQAKEFLSWPSFVTAFDEYLDQRVSALRTELISEFSSGYSFEISLFDELEVFSPELQFGGVIIEF